MKVEIAVHVLLAITLTFALVWWLYPLNVTSIGILFLISSCLVVICLYICRKIIQFLEGAE